MDQSQQRFYGMNNKKSFQWHERVSKRWETTLYFALFPFYLSLSSWSFYLIPIKPLSIHEFREIQNILITSSFFYFEFLPTLDVFSSLKTNSWLKQTGKNPVRSGRIGSIPGMSTDSWKVSFLIRCLREFQFLIRCD